MRLVLAVALLPVISWTAGAQESRGAILGRITDGSGAVVAGAKVHAANVATNTGASTVTNSEGNYEIPFLIPGTYRVTVDLEGFKRLVKDGVELSVDDRLALDLTLELGSVNETVVVTAEAPMLEASSPSIGVIVDDLDPDPPGDVLEAREELNLGELALRDSLGRAHHFAAQNLRASRNRVFIFGEERRTPSEDHPPIPQPKIIQVVLVIEDHAVLRAEFTRQRLG